MNCPECDSPSKVLDSRPKPNYKYRRRKCIICDHKFSTRVYEVDALINLKENYLALQDEVKRLRIADRLLRREKIGIL